MTTPTPDDLGAASASTSEPTVAPTATRPWFKKKRFIIPAIILVIIIFANAANSGSDNTDGDVPAASESESANSDSGATEETAEPEEPAEPEIQTWTAGTYIVGDEIEPGQYRVAGYWARLDKNMEIIDNEAIWSDNGFLVVQIEEGDAYIEFSGEAIRLEDSLAMDPVAEGFTEGTYVVGYDIQPGRYRITGDSAYYARLTCDNDIIDNNLSDGSVLVVLKESDCYLNFSGEISKID